MQYVVIVSAKNALAAYGPFDSKSAADDWVEKEQDLLRPFNCTISAIYEIKDTFRE